MQEEPRFPVFDAEKMARALLRDAQESRSGGEIRVPVAAEEVRWLARKRGALALGTLPLFVLIGGGALLVSINLALVAVLGGFFAYACVSIAGRQRGVAREAVSFEVIVRGNQLCLPGQAPRAILRAIDRPDYLRLLSTEARVVGLWLDNRRDPTASFDLPTSARSRRELCASLREAGVTVTTEGGARRVVVLAGSLALGISGLGAARVLLKLTAVAGILWPMGLVFLGAIVVVVWLSGRRRE